MAALALLWAAVGCASASGNSEAEASREPDDLIAISNRYLVPNLFERVSYADGETLLHFAEDVGRCVHSRTGDERLLTGLPHLEIEFFTDIVIACRATLNLELHPVHRTYLHVDGPRQQVVAPCLVGEHGWAQGATIEDGVMGAVRPGALSDAETRADLADCGFYTHNLRVPFCVLFICF